MTSAIADLIDLDGAGLCVADLSEGEVPVLGPGVVRELRVVVEPRPSTNESGGRDPAVD